MRQGGEERLGTSTARQPQALQASVLHNLRLDGGGGGQDVSGIWETWHSCHPSHLCASASPHSHTSIHTLMRLWHGKLSSPLMHPKLSSSLRLHPCPTQVSLCACVCVCGERERGRKGGRRDGGREGGWGRGREGRREDGRREGRREGGRERERGRKRVPLACRRVLAPCEHHPAKTSECGIRAHGCIRASFSRCVRPNLEKASTTPTALGVCAHTEGGRR